MKNYYSKMAIAAVALLPLVSPSAAGVQALESSQPTASPQPEGVRSLPITLDPAAESEPALKFPLFHEVIDQNQGNAAIAYQIALQLFRQNDRWSEDLEQFRKWLECPLADLPKETLESAMANYRSGLGELRRASRFERCDWQLPIRDQGAGTLLPYLAGLRDMARVLAIEIRWNVAQGQHAEAIEGIRTGLSLAKHTGQGATLIEGLVGISIARVMLDRVEELIQQPDAPNLYWSLTDLPPDFLNLWQSTRWERSFLYAHLPSLRRLDERSASAADLYAVVEQLQSLGGPALGDGVVQDRDRSMMTALGAALVIYPRARQFLLAHGWSDEAVDGLPVPEAILRFLRESYEIQRDHLFKWFALPYAQARQGLAEREARLDKDRRIDPVANFLPGMLLPALSRASQRFAELDRKIALLRTVEAIRMHAALQSQQLPRELTDISTVPVPEDPMTGLPFEYNLNGETASLATPPVAGVKPTAYEIRLRK